MKKIPLTHGRFALVDDEDYDELAQFHWRLENTRGFLYARRYHRFPGRDSNMSMHRQILKLSDPKILVDHIDHDGLNNQKSNLRIGGHSINNKNRKANKTSTSKYVGVCRHKRDGVWQAQFGITVNGEKKQFYIGSFDSEEDAAKARDEFAKKYNGGLAYLNIK